MEIGQPSLAALAALMLASFSARCSAISKSWRFVAASSATSRSTSSARTSPMSAWEKVCIWKNSPSAIASGISSARRSRISSAMRAFDTITSTAGMRPPPACGRSRWLITPRSTPARIETTCGCFSAGRAFFFARSLPSFFAPGGVVLGRDFPGVGVGVDSGGGVAAAPFSASFASSRKI